MRGRWIYVLLFFLAIGFELVYTTYSWAVAHGHLLLALVTTAMFPWVGLVEAAALIDAKGWRQRVLIGAITSAGFVIGTTVVLLVVRR